LNLIQAFTMKANRTLPYVALVAALALQGCSTSQQVARNGGETDDLYGNSSDAYVYRTPEAGRSQTTEQRYTDNPVNTRRARNVNPDFTEQTDRPLFNEEEYYSDLSARKVGRGISPDPGWSNNYNDGFVDGFNAANWTANNNAWRWNRFGWAGPAIGFSTGFGLGYGMWGPRSWYGFYDPFWGPAMAYDPFWGSGFYGGGWGWNRWGYSPWGMNGFYDPFWGGGFYGGGGWNRRPVVVVNNFNNVVGADRNYRYGARTGASGASGRYNGEFVNTPRANPNDGGRRAGSLNPSNNTYYNNSGNSRSESSDRDSYYSRGRANSNGNGYYYGGGSSEGARTSGSTTAPSYNSGNSASGNDSYYARPRQNSRGSYTPPSDNGSQYRYSAPSTNSGSSDYAQPRYSQPSYSQPSYSQPSRSYDGGGSRGSSTYSSPSPSYNSGGSRGGSSSSGSSGSYSGGGSRGPR